MKKLKKIIAIALALAMVLTMNMTAFAANHTITIASVQTGETAHTFDVYQIFTGTYSEDENGKDVLSDLKWGKNGTGTEGQAVSNDVVMALKAASGNDAQKLAVIENYFNDGSERIDTVASGGSINVADGYYILIDTTNLSGQDDANSTNVVQVVGENITVTPKTVKPTVDKEVYDNDDGSEFGDNNGWGETADHQIGESFQFRLTAEIPADANMDAYSTYQVVFQDTMSDGVTFESIESVTINDEKMDDGDYTSTAEADQEGGNWSLTIANIKDHVTGSLSAGVEIEVIYNAHLNENAVVNTPGESGSTTNENNVYLQYSNNPNGNGLGQTALDSVWVFTYEMPNQKVDGSNNNAPLEGAGFTLYSSANEAIRVVPESTQGEYRVAQIERYDNGTPVYEEGAVTEMTSAKANQEEATPATFNISGLDAGTYTLKETKTPGGYNTCADVTIVISANHSESAEGVATTTLSMTQNGSSTTTNTIVNESGTILPETGGIGTIIFYVAGGALMVVAVTLLVTRRRAQKR